MQRSGVVSSFTFTGVVVQPTTTSEENRHSKRRNIATGLTSSENRYQGKRSLYFAGGDVFDCSACAMFERLMA